MTAIDDATVTTSKVGGWVRRARRVARWSQRDLARRMGVSQSTVCRWESGRLEPDSGQLEHLLGLAGLRLAVVEVGEVGEVGGVGGGEPCDREVAPMREDAARDRAGRRLPAHLDVLCAERWHRHSLWGPDGVDPRWWGVPHARMVRSRFWVDVLRRGDVAEDPARDHRLEDHPTLDQLETMVRAREAALVRAGLMRAGLMRAGLMRAGA